MMAIAVPHPHVTSSEDVLGGTPVVTGSRVPVRRIWTWHRKGVSVETLVKRYPSLGWAKVCDALAFAYDNQELIEADLDRERALLDAPMLEREPQTSLLPGTGEP